MKTYKGGLKLFQEMSNIFLATLREDGTPDVRAISVVKSDGYRTIWMISGAHEKKARELTRDPRSMVYATTMDDDEAYAEARLWGTTELLSDRETIDAVWNDIYLRYFPGGKDDPGLRIYKFSATSGTVSVMGAQGPEVLDIPQEALR